DAADGQMRKRRARRWHGQGRCGVTGDDDVLWVQRLEIGDDLADEQADRRSALRAVGEAGRVAEVDDVLLWQAPPQRSHDGQTAQAAVENHYRGTCVHEILRNPRPRRLLR